MRCLVRFSLLPVCLGMLHSFALAQAPGDGAVDPTRATPKRAEGNASAVDAIVVRMMAFDKNKDGKLTRDEIADTRLLRLFDRADANKDGVVTRQELISLATQLVADDAASSGRRRRFGPPGGGPGGFGGPRGRGGPPQPGQILPPFLQDELNLTDEQKKQVALLQKEVDEKLEKLLTGQQKEQLNELRQRFGRGRPGGPGGPGPEGRRRGGRGPDGPGDENGPPDRGPSEPPPSGSQR